MKTIDIKADNIYIYMQSTDTEQNKQINYQANMPCFCGVSCCVISTLTCGLPAASAVFNSICGACCCICCLECLIGDRTVKIFNNTDKPITRQPK